MKTIILSDVNSVTILTNQSSTDNILINLNDTSGFPGMDYPTVLKVEVAKGRGVGWCKDILGIDNPCIIDLLSQTRKE